MCFALHFPPLFASSLYYLSHASIFPVNYLLWISCIFVLYLDFASSFLDLFALLASGSSTLSYSLVSTPVTLMDDLWVVHNSFFSGAFFTGAIRTSPTSRELYVIVFEIRS